MTATPGPGQAAPPPASTSAGAARQAPTLYTSSLGTSSSSSSTSRPAPRFSGIRSRYAAFQAGRVYRSYAFLSRHKRKLLLGAGLLYFSTSYASAAVRAKKRDRIAEDTYLYFRVHDGAIVEAKSSATALSNLLLTQGNGSDEPARVMTLFEVIRALNWAATDDRIKGIIADFTSLSQPAVQTSYSLGLAQIEEVADAIDDLNKLKAERLGADKWRSIAFTDSFESQAQYTLASAFNEIYMQPTGEVPLVGLGSQIPFFKRLIDWLGVKVHAEAREEYKSFVAQYTEERLTEPQTQNQMELLHSLNDLMLQRIARNRFEREVPHVEMINPSEFARSFDTAQRPGRKSEEGESTGTLQEIKDTVSEAVEAKAASLSNAVRASAPIEDGEEVTEASKEAEASASEGAEITRDIVPTTGSESTDAVLAAVAPGNTALADADGAFEKLKKLTFDGPFSAKEAAEHGLITGMSYRSYILDSILEPEYGGSEENKLMGFYHYHKVMERAMARKAQPTMEIGVVHLMGTIGERGDFDAASVVRGLRQAGEDEEIGAVVLRIDSGGGGVVDSDSIDQAVRDIREKKGKVVIASFANSAASGGYLSACHADAILAHPSSVTGSIGVAAIRPTFTPDFLSKIKLTVQSILTGSSAQDLTKELDGKHLAKHRKHIDETYQDFKDRVVEGRGIHPELINSLAGGRVYTGQMAFDLVDNANKEKAARNAAQEVAEKAQSGGVQIAEDQETSPFAPPEPADNIATGEAGEVADVETMDPGEAIRQALGPLGRGIIDGLGGIRDSAALAAEVYLTRALAEIKLERPETSDEVALEEVLPGLKYEKSEDGTSVTVPLDVNLKQFPLEKSFWQWYREASSQGDAMTDPAASLSAGGMLVNFPQMAKMALASWIIGTASKVLTEEMDSVGLADVRRGLGIGQKARGRAWLRAEAPKWTTS